MGRIPNYLRTTTNKYKGLITEKVALNYLTKEGYLCEEYILAVRKVNDIEGRDWKQWTKKMTEAYKGTVEEYSSKSPTDSLWKYHLSFNETWEDYRKRQLKSLEYFYLGRIEEEREFERNWGTHFKYIKEYQKWLRDHEHYRPDFLVKKGDEVFIVEVKSQSSKEKTSLFEEHQQKALKMAYNYGLKPMLLIVPLNIDIEIGEPQFKTIEQ